MEKSGLGSKGVWGPIFDDHPKNGKCHKLRTCILIDISLAAWNCYFPKRRKVFIFVLSRASGNFKNHLKPLFFDSATINRLRKIRSLYLYDVQGLWDVQILTSITLVSVKVDPRNPFHMFLRAYTFPHKKTMLQKPKRSQPTIPTSMPIR